MEKCNRIPMINVPLMRSADDHPNFEAKIGNYLKSKDQDPKEFEQELIKLESLKAKSIKVSSDDPEGIEKLKEYLTQLNYLKRRFPLDEGSDYAIRFSWYGLYSKIVHGWSDIDFEISCIVFNIAALHMNLASGADRTKPDELKDCCINLQNGAWAFSHYFENFKKFVTSDIPLELFEALEFICIAQAQLCVLEKSWSEKKSPIVSAKLLAGVVHFFQKALNSLNVILKVKGNTQANALKESVNARLGLFNLLGLYYLALNAKAKGAWGERVAYFKEAIQHAKSVSTFERSDELLKWLREECEKQAGMAEKDNEMIYFYPVPKEVSGVSDAVEPAILVKKIQFQLPTDENLDIFANLTLN